MEKLSDKMKERLEKWRLKTPNLPTAHKCKTIKINNYIARKCKGDQTFDEVKNG